MGGAVTFRWSPPCHEVSCVHVRKLSVCFAISVSAAGERGQVERGDGAAVNLQQQTAQRGTDHFLLFTTR